MGAKVKKLKREVTDYQRYSQSEYEVVHHLIGSGEIERAIQMQTNAAHDAHRARIRLFQLINKSR